MKNKVFLLGVGFSSIKINEVLEFIIKGLAKDGKKYYIVTPNPEILTIASSNPNYKTVLNNAELALPDGVGVMLAAKLLDKPLKEVIHGVDLMESLCKGVSKQPITVGFLGGGTGIANKTSECLQKKYPGLKVVFTSEEWDEDNFKFQISPPAKAWHWRAGNFKSIQQSKNAKIRESMGDGRPKKNSTALDLPQNELSYSGKEIINHKSTIINQGIDILFVAFGSPKQEIWIAENLDKLPVKVAIGVGGAFDFVSGKVKRAPVWVRKIGLEWLFRLILQPWRIKRQLRLFKFVFLVLGEKVKAH